MEEYIYGPFFQLLYLGVWHNKNCRLIVYVFKMILSFLIYKLWLCTWKCTQFNFLGLKNIFK